MTVSARILGRGWDVPAAPDALSRRLVYLDGPEKVRQSILHHPRHRARRAHHAAGVRLRAAALPDEAEHDRDARADPARRRARARAFEPRIRITSVRVDPATTRRSSLIQIAYVHVARRPPGQPRVPVLPGVDGRCRSPIPSSTTARTSSSATSWCGAFRSTRRSGPTTTPATPASRSSSCSRSSARTCSSASTRSRRRPSSRSCGCCRCRCGPRPPRARWSRCRPKRPAGVLGAASAPKRGPAACSFETMTEVTVCPLDLHRLSRAFSSAAPDRRRSRRCSSSPCARSTPSGRWPRTSRPVYYHNEAVPLDRASGAAGRLRRGRRRDALGRGGRRRRRGHRRSSAAPSSTSASCPIRSCRRSTRSTRARAPAPTPADARRRLAGLDRHARQRAAAGLPEARRSTATPRAGSRRRASSGCGCRTIRRTRSIRRTSPTSPSTTPTHAAPASSRRRSTTRTQPRTCCSGSARFGSNQSGCSAACSSSAPTPPRSCRPQGGRRVPRHRQRPAGPTLPLVHRPVLDGSLVIEVEEAGRWVPLERGRRLPRERARTTGTSSSTSRRARCASATACRARRRRSAQRIRAVEYRYGGGAEGNVAAEGDQQARRAVAGVKVVRTRCARAAARTPSRSTPRSTRIPGELRRRDRAVTAGDFQELALATPGADVGRAECLPRFHPPTATPRARGRRQRGGLAARGSEAPERAAARPHAAARRVRLARRAPAGDDRAVRRFRRPTAGRGLRRRRT